MNALKKFKEAPLVVLGLVILLVGTWWAWFGMTEAVGWSVVITAIICFAFQLIVSGEK